jgi:RimJ/RimL family protein N-acetyltransferase
MGRLAQSSLGAGQKIRFPHCRCPIETSLGYLRNKPGARNLSFCNLGYWIRTSRIREGAATEAIRLLAQFGFSTLQLVRIEIVVAAGNLASQKAAEKAGAMREGLLANRLIHREEIRDAYLFSLVPPVRLPGSIHVG